MPDDLHCFCERQQRSDIFHFRRPPGLRLVFDAAERNKKFGRIRCQRSEESCNRGKRISSAEEQSVSK